jgi:YegS/Rv2252/BmrU family lipid kinase
MRILVIVNPVAGGKKVVRRLPDVRRWLSKSAHDFSYSITESSAEMCSEIIGASREGVDAILLLGGDGTVHKALPAIAEANLPFGFLPCGRGNDLARNVGLSLNLRKNCSFSTRPSVHQVDLPEINGVPFISIAYVGFDGEVNKLANEGKGYFGGKLGYIICVLRALRKFRPFKIEMTIDGRSIRERVMMVTIANAPFYGGGMKIAPQAIMNDGVLDICIVKEISRWELLRQFPKVFKGTHITHPRIVMTSGRRISLVSDESRDIFADGEFVGNLPAECTIGNQTIQILLP